MMYIEYELKFRDYLAFSAVHQLLSIPAQIFCGGIALFIFAASLHDKSLAGSAIAASVAYIAMWVIQLLFTIFYLYFGKNRSLITKHIVEIQDEAFYEETWYRSFRYWPKVVRRPGFIAVYTNAKTDGVRLYI